MPRSSQPAANDPQSRSPAASNAACISGARTKAKPPRPIVSAIAAKKSVIRTFLIQTSLMWSCHVQFHPKPGGVSTPTLECEVAHTRMVQFQINTTHTVWHLRAYFSCRILDHTLLTIFSCVIG